ncbi:MAG: hypothetical protein II359_05340 [Clostridia bacterium]|nr:hypothetical protein [Clostridia bacterium]
MKKKIIIFILCFICALCTFPRSSGGLSVDAASDISLIPLGDIVAIHMQTDGLLCLGFCDVGGVCPAKEAGLRPGDRILLADDRPIHSSADFSAAIDKKEAVRLLVARAEETFSCTLTPTYSSGQAFIGMWVREDLSGVGTLSFYNPKDSSFVALGHSVTDPDLCVRLPVRAGKIYPAKLLSVQKGIRGTPGEILAARTPTARPIGEIHENQSFGIFGTYEASTNSTAYPIGIPTRGKATLLSQISGETKAYEIEIKKLFESPKASGKDFELLVTDPELLHLTGGIIRGMSGSPILQNGRIVGAVTHVFVNDPTRGYGIFIENMLAEAEKIK